MVGKQMPGFWRAGLVASLHAPGSISSWSHFVLFVVMAALALPRPFGWPWTRVVLCALVLALVSEGLQFFAMERHHLLDVGIDILGALAGMLLAMLVSRIKPVLTSAN